MAKAGEIIENPVTGERIVFVETAADSGGARLRLALHLAPHAHNASAHRHARQEERIAVVKGQLRIAVAGAAPRVLAAGEEVVVPPGVSHQWWTHGGARAEIAIEYRPALDTEEFFESFFALGRAGKTTAAGAPRFLQGVVMARRYEIWDGGAPIWLQRIACTLLAPIARALGHRARFAETDDGPGARPALRTD